MTHLHRHNPHPCQPALHVGHRPRFRMFLLIPLAGMALALASCSSEPPRSSVPVTDTRPVGDGLKVVGYAMLGAAVVIVAGRLIRS
jgi:hypothetical protein